MFTVENSAGDEVVMADSLATALQWARNALEDDPEVGGFEVYERPQDGSQAVLRKTVTWGPDADWNTVVVVLEPGERVEPPRAVAIREDGSLRMEPDEDAYDPSDPKHPTYHERMSAVWDERADK